MVQLGYALFTILYCIEGPPALGQEKIFKGKVENLPVKTVSCKLFEILPSFIYS